MKIKACADYGWVNTNSEWVFEVDDNTSMEEIDEIVWQWAIERVGTNWEVIE